MTNRTNGNRVALTVSDDVRTRLIKFSMLTGHAGKLDPAVRELCERITKALETGNGLAILSLLGYEQVYSQQSFSISAGFNNSQLRQVG